MAMRSRILAILFALVALPVYADDDAVAIANVEKYLTSLSTLVASFNQIENDGRTATGKFFLKRPGKMRWQYDPPAPILLVSNGTTITYYDSDLDQVNYLPVDESLAGFMAEPVIKLESDSIHLTDFKWKDGTIRATIVRKDAPEEGSLTLVFLDKPITIQKMIVRDATGQKTTINLEDGRIGVVLPDSLFEFQDPRGIAPRRKH
jgi:outer membrane lipoprotein-sorting protein